ncbi:MAG: glucokinase [Proteobacteria bacterium]|nr:MAG: glucokinase [Pseudomonadota bacterium]
MELCLVADIGGTNARLGLLAAESGELLNIEQFSNKDFSLLADVIQFYLQARILDSPLKRACFAVASPILGDQISFTNNSWSFSIADLKAEFGWDELHVMNDFEAIARSLPHLREHDIHRIGTHGQCTSGQTIAVLGPGTGLGVGAAVPSKNGFIPLPSEGGHASFHPHDETERYVADFLLRERGFVCIEDVLSGQGLENIYRALSARAHADKPFLTAEIITRQALATTNPLALQTLHTFCAILGSVAGDIALTLGARGGVYLAGGILPRFLPFLEQSAFRSRFEAKGSYRSYAAGIGSYVIINKQPGLLGAATYFRD